jgi:HAD superfamily hydrolase (TIGR01490 family)
MDHIFSEFKNTQKKYVAFFDLDRTLISEISGNTLVRRAWRKGILSWSDIGSVIYLYLLYKLKLRDPIKVLDYVVGRVQGKPEAELEALCSEVNREVLLPSVFREAIKEINFHKENNAEVIILSSTLNSIGRAVSESLGMDGYICSSLEAKGGYLTGRPIGQLCFGEEKLNRLTAYCKTNTMNQSDSWYYGDSIYDLSVLSSVGNQVCVNPDRELKKEALKRGWKIYLWNH